MHLFSVINLALCSVVLIGLTRANFGFDQFFLWWNVNHGYEWIMYWTDHFSLA